MTSTAACALTLVEAPVSPDEVAAFLPTLATALEGGAPLLCLPPPGPERERLTEAGRGRTVAAGVALTVPTSGSTGSPRLALLSGSALKASADGTHAALGGPGRWLLALPTTHVAGQQVLVRSLRAGLAPTVVDTTGGFTVAAFADAVTAMDVASAEQPHYTALVPTQLKRLLDDGAGVESLWQLDAVLVGGSAVPAELLARAAEAGVTVITTYGMTETCGGCVYDGAPLPGVNVAIADDGRIQIAGATLFDGYLGEEVPLVDGWFTSSDLGYVDGGTLHVLGRADNVIVTGGVNVPAEAVERALLTVPGVDNAVVVGVADAEWGERLVALVGADSAIDVEAARSSCRNVLPAEWLPREIVTLEALPMLSSGKPDRAAARHIAAVLAR